MIDSSRKYPQREEKEDRERVSSPGEPEPALYDADFLQRSGCMRGSSVQAP